MGLKEADVAKGVRSRLELWRIRNIVSRYERIQCGKIKTIYGSWIKLCDEGFPDYMVFIPLGKMLHLAFFETKKPVGGTISYSQMLFAKTHGEYINTSWDLITDPNQVDIRIEKLTGYTQKALDGIKF